MWYQYVTKMDKVQNIITQFDINSGKNNRPNDKGIIMEAQGRQLLNKHQQHGPVKNRLYLINLNDFFVHTMERETKQRGDKSIQLSQSAERSNKLQKDLTKMGNLIIYQKVTVV